MGRSKRYWYDVVDSFLGCEEAYHKRNGSMHDQSIIDGKFIVYELCGNEIARMTLDRRYLFIRTAGWNTPTTRSRLFRLVPFPFTVRSRAPYNYIEYMAVLEGGTSYLIPEYNYLGLDLKEYRVMGVYNSEMELIGEPNRVVMYVRKPKCKADVYYRMDYGEGGVDKVFLGYGEDLFLIIPSENFIGHEFLRGTTIADFIETDKTKKEVFKIVTGDDFFEEVMGEIAHLML